MHFQRDGPMAKGQHLTQLPSQAILLCLQQLVRSMQEEDDNTQALAHSPQVSTKLWQKQDLDAFVEVLHSI